MVEVELSKETTRVKRQKWAKLVASCVFYDSFNLILDIPLKGNATAGRSDGQSSAAKNTRKRI